MAQRAQAVRVGSRRRRGSDSRSGRPNSPSAATPTAATIASSAYNRSSGSTWLISTAGQ